MPHRSRDSSAAPASEPSHAVRCGWFSAWAAAGATGALGLISLEPVASVPAVIAGVLMARRPDTRRSLFGLASGAGLLSIFVAYGQRTGPGTTCWHTARAAGCDQHLNPIPWLLVGVLLTLGGVIGQRRHGTRASAAP